jgi:type II secretory pathway component PulF
LSQFCQRVGTALQAGIDVRRVWETESQRGGWSQRATMQSIRDQIGRGESLSNAFGQTREYFPPLVREMVEVGERTGHLDQVFLQLGEHYDHLLQLRQSFLFAIAWPAIELGLALTAIGVFIWLYGFLALTDMEGRPITMLGFYGVSGLIQYILILVGIGGILAAPFVAVRQGWIDVGPFYRLLAMIPGMGSAVRSMALSRLSWALSIASNSDLSAQRVVDLAVRSTQNSYYTTHLDRMRREIRQGRSLHTAFQVTGIYPVEFLDALETGETAGRISETMEILARQYQDRARAQSRILAAVAGVLVLLVVFGILIAFIFKLFFQVYSPVFEMVDSL